jgi:hypothetical protein
MTGKQDERLGGEGKNPVYFPSKKRARWRLRHRHGRAAARVFLEETNLDEKSSLLRDILDCPECRTAFGAVRDVWKKSEEILKPLEQYGPLPADILPRLNALAAEEVKKLRSRGRTGKRSAFGLRYVLGGGAAVLLVLVTVIFLRPRFSGEGLQERSSNGRGFAVLEPWDLARERPLIFRWKSLAQIDHYELEILDSELATVFRQGGIAASSFPLPQEAYDRLGKSRTYFWKVTATLRSGESIESEFGKFTLPEP